jgi:Holliday junction resolvase
MVRMSRTKGQRIERALVHLHQDAGIPATRMPLSGAADGEYAGDLHILDLRAEVKARKDGSSFK